jgi:hypothetical protein
MKATAAQVAAVFGAPVKNVKAQYASNAKDLRAFAVKAGTGKYRGKTAVEWTSYAEHAERQAK